MLTISVRWDFPVRRISSPSTMSERGMSAGRPTLTNWYCSWSGTPTCPVCELIEALTCARETDAAQSNKAAAASRRGAKFMGAFILPVSNDILKVLTFAQIDLFFLAL